MALPKKWFHGTFMANIQQLWPLSHIGTHGAALQVLAKKHVIYGYINPILHEVALQLQPSQILEVTDWYSPSPMGFLSHMKDANLGQDLKNQVSVLYEKLWRDGKFAKEFRAYANGEIAKLFIAHGIKAIGYPNEIEGCIGENSICIMDASIAKLSNPIAISTEEWEAALRPRGV